MTGSAERPGLYEAAGPRHDADRDGLGDGAEVRRYGTSPRRRDTDEDGLGDGAEVKRYRTSPRRRDTDHDSFGDGLEVLRLRSNPLDSSDPPRVTGAVAPVTPGQSPLIVPPSPPSSPPPDPPPPPPPPPVDETPPETTITSQPPATTASTEADFTFTASEAGSTFTCRLDEGSWSDCASPKSFSGLSVGTHTFSVRATDGAGNVDPTPASGEWEIESPPPPPPPPPCSVTVASLAALRAAVDEATGGSVICLEDGSYGAVAIDGPGDGPVTVRARTPGGAQIAGASLGGSQLTLSNFDIAGSVDVLPGSDHVTVAHSRISGGEHGVQAAPTTDLDVSDVEILGNRFVGPFGEDAIRLNRYHDGSDPDPYGILIEGNEITGVRENGNHSDCLQSVWGGDSLYFRRNYLHDNRCQGFFVKDQPSIVETVVVEDNLFLRNAEPCAPGAEDCGQPAILQVFGPMADLEIAGNTVWTPEENAPLAIRDGSWAGIALHDNVIWRGYSDWEGEWGGYGEEENTVCLWEGTLPALSVTSSLDCSPSFLAPAADDYRLPSGRGVDWAPGDQHYGF